MAQLTTGIPGDLTHNTEQFTKGPKALFKNCFQFSQTNFVLLEARFELFTQVFFANHSRLGFVQQALLVSFLLLELTNPVFVGPVIGRPTLLNAA